MHDRRTPATRCPTCTSTSMQMIASKEHIVYRCLQCGREWPERRLAMVQDEGSLSGEAARAAVHEVCNAQDLSQLLATTLHNVRNLTHADGVSCLLRVGEGCYCADDADTAPFGKGNRPAHAGATGWVMRQKDAVIVHDIASQGVVDAAILGSTVQSLLVVPIRREDPVGAIVAYWHRTQGPTSAHAQVTELIAEAVSFPLRRPQLSAELHQLVSR